MKGGYEIILTIKVGCQLQIQESVVAQKIVCSNGY